MSYDLKRDPNKSRGDTLEVILRDINLSTYYRESAHIDNNKEMSNLIKTLKEKGVSFPTSWFE